MDIERLVNRHKDSVYRQMVRVCGNHADADDALAEALLSGVKSADSLKSPEHFQAWLAKIGTRICARMKVRNRLLQICSISDLESGGFQLVDAHPDPEMSAVEAELKNCVHKAVDELPPILREVYVLREIQGEPAEAVAQHLGISVSSVKSRLHRARGLVRTALDGTLN